MQQCQQATSADEQHCQPRHAVRRLSTINLEFLHPLSLFALFLSSCLQHQVKGSPLSKLVFVLEGVVALQTQIVKRLHVLLESGTAATRSPSSSSVLGVYLDLAQPMAVFARYRWLVRAAQNAVTLIVQQPGFQDLWQDCLSEGLALRQGDTELRDWSRPLPRTLLGWVQEAIAKADAIVPTLERLAKMLREPAKQQYAQHTLHQVSGSEIRRHERERDTRSLLQPQRSFSDFYRVARTWLCCFSPWPRLSAALRWHETVVSLFHRLQWTPSFVLICIPVAAKLTSLFIACNPLSFFYSPFLYVARTFPILSIAYNALSFFTAYLH